MVKINHLILIFFLCLSPVLLTDGPSSGEGAGGVLFSEVNPYGGYEGMSVFNYGPAGVNLKGWSVSDGEGTLTFIKDIRIESGSRLTLAKAVSKDDWFSGRDSVITFTDPRIEKKGTVALADAGDDLYLYNGTKLVDSVCYGGKQTEQGWKGDPVKLSSGKYLLRISSADTDTLADWILTKPGLTNDLFDPERFFDAAVEPFSFPESEGAPILRALEKAEKEVLISLYLMTSVDLTALLCDLASRGVTVRVLLEGSVLGMDLSAELALMGALAASGGDVCMINDPAPKNFERFSYFHNKYAVIDQKTVIITSENWTADNLGPRGNRGWGAVIESGGYAEYVRGIFLNDVDPRYGDVHPLADYVSSFYPSIKPYSGDLTYGGVSSSYLTTAYDARVMPSFSPDNSWSALNHFINNAAARVYSQQMDIGSSYQTFSDRSPLGWLYAAAERGVDARLILDASTDAAHANKIVSDINSASGIEAISLRGSHKTSPVQFSMIHNKGVIIDDMVWIASVNWTENSFMNNREAAVIIDSPEVAGFFAELYLIDWGADPSIIEEIVLEATFEELIRDGTRIHIFAVSGPERSAYLWDALGDGDLRGSSINRAVYTDLPEGTHTMTVKMDGTEYSASITYTIEGKEEPGPPAGTGADHPWLLAAAAAALLTGAAAVFVRRNNNP